MSRGAAARSSERSARRGPGRSSSAEGEQVPLAVAETDERRRPQSTAPLSIRARSRPRGRDPSLRGGTRRSLRPSPFQSAPPVDPRGEVRELGHRHCGHDRTLGRALRPSGLPQLSSPSCERRRSLMTKPAIGGWPSRKVWRVGAAVIVSGMIAATPRQGGATWAVLQYLLGLRRLGCEVLLRRAGRRARRARPDTLRYAADVMARSGSAIAGRSSRRGRRSGRHVAGGAADAGARAPTCS